MTKKNIIAKPRKLNYAILLVERMTSSWMISTSIFKEKALRTNFIMTLGLQGL